MLGSRNAAGGACAWLPQDFVAAAPLFGRELFLDEHRGPFLLVRLDAPTSELAIGLHAASSLGRPRGELASGDKLAFATVAHGQDTVRRIIKDGRQGATGKPDLEACRAMMSEPRFIVPIAKRADASTVLERVTVGRARNNDLVLRHKSVSKFHAFWAQDASGLWLEDAGSKNSTLVNGVQLSGERVRIEMGAQVRFGSVEATVCSAESLWELIGGPA